MRFLAIVFAALAACSPVPPTDTPYFEVRTSGDNLYAASTVRIYANDQRIVTADPHPQNNNRGARDVSKVPGAFQSGLAALQEPAIARNEGTSQVPPDPDACCHTFVQRQFTYFDGIRVIGITEAVWRRVDGVPPFVDLPIPPR